MCIDSLRLKRHLFVVFVRIPGFIRYKVGCRTSMSKVKSLTRIVAVLLDEQDHLVTVGR